MQSSCQSMFCFTSFRAEPLAHCPLFAILAHWGDNLINQVVVFTLGALSWVDHCCVDSPVHMLPVLSGCHGVSHTVPVWFMASPAHCLLLAPHPGSVLGKTCGWSVGEGLGEVSEEPFHGCVSLWLLLGADRPQGGVCSSPQRKSLGSSVTQMLQWAEEVTEVCEDVLDNFACRE